MNKESKKYKIKCIGDLKKKRLHKILKSSKEFRELHDIKGMKIISISSSRIGEGYGFLGDTYRVKVFYATKSSNISEEIPFETKEISIVLKLSSAGWNKKMLDKIFKPEIKFYENQDLFHNAKDCFPKHFFSNLNSKSGSLIMEYINESEDMKRSFSDGLTEKQIEATLVSLAKFHSNTISNRKESDVDWVTSNIKPLLKYYKVKLTEIRSKHHNLFSEKTIQHLSSLKKNLKKMWDNMHENSQLNCICHGDMWANNVLFKSSESGKLTSFLLDFQFLSWGSPILDLLQLFSTSCSSELRLQKEEYWIKKIYFPNLKSFSSERLDTVDLHTEDSFYKFYQDNKWFGLAFSVASLDLFFNEDVHTQNKLFSRFLSLVEVDD